jgi:hypothetical protein
MRDWENYKPNWYSAKITVKSDEQFEELMMWMQSNLPGHNKHTTWRLLGLEYTSDRLFEIRFRYDRDYALFILRWG